MTETVTIEELEAALAFHMRGYDKATLTLPRAASVIVDVYGVMTYERRTAVEWSVLTPLQQDLVREALSARRQVHLPPGE